MAAIELEHITKRYPDGTEAVADLNLKIADGEFVNASPMSPASAMGRRW